VSPPENGGWVPTCSAGSRCPFRVRRLQYYCNGRRRARGQAAA
jgi:hypothetical protein